MRFGTVSLVGRTNVGKSTFLNAALGEDLAIVSPLPQTTRDTLLGVVHRPDAQIAFVDTPGLHRPRSELGRRMNAAALEAARTTDAIAFFTDGASVEKGLPKASLVPGADTDRLVPARDRELIALLPPEAVCVLVVNKVDRVRPKSNLLPLLAAYGELREFDAIVPVSVRRADGVDRVLDVLAEKLPEGPPGYDENTLTDRPASFFVREYVREQVMLAASREVPHAVAVTVDSFADEGERMVIAATIHVEKAGQKAIVIGAGGSMLKRIGSGARGRLEKLLDAHVRLELFVRVTPRWKHVPRQLAELGYDTPGTDLLGPGGDER